MEPASFITVASFIIVAFIVEAIASTIFRKKDPK